jgi:hypothetical protein
MTRCAHGHRRRINRLSNLAGGRWLAHAGYQKLAHAVEWSLSVCETPRSTTVEGLTMYFRANNMLQKSVDELVSLNPWIGAVAFTLDEGFGSFSPLNPLFVNGKTVSDTINRTTQCFLLFIR